MEEIEEGDEEGSEILERKGGEKETEGFKGTQVREIKKLKQKIFALHKAHDQSKDCFIIQYDC